MFFWPPSPDTAAPTRKYTPLLKQSMEGKHAIKAQIKAPNQSTGPNHQMKASEKSTRPKLESNASDQSIR